MCVSACIIQVLWAEQQVVKKRKKRDLFEDPTDPDFPKQWYLVGNGLFLFNTQDILNVKKVKKCYYFKNGIYCVISSRFLN